MRLPREGKQPAGRMAVQMINGKDRPCKRFSARRLRRPLVSLDDPSIAPKDESGHRADTRVDIALSREFFVCTAPTESDQVFGAAGFGAAGDAVPQSLVARVIASGSEHLLNFYGDDRLRGGACAWGAESLRRSPLGAAGVPGPVNSAIRARGMVPVVAPQPAPGRAASRTTDSRRRSRYRACGRRRGPGELRGRGR